MPIEGLPTESANAQGGEGANAQTPANTSDATAQNTGAGQPGAATQTATTEAQPEKTFSQTEVDRMFQTRLKSAVKAELKKLTGETEGQPNVEDLQRQLSDYQTKIRSFEARSMVQEHLNDGRNKLNLRPENIRGIEELVVPRLEYDDNGKPTNLKEAIESAKSIAPALFINTAANINQSQRQSAPVSDMNAFIRQQAGVG